MSFGSFVKKNLTKVVVIGIAGVAVIISAVAFISSAVEYANYSKDYDARKAALEAQFAKLPESIFIDDEYVSYSDDGLTVESSKSSYNQSTIFYAADAEVRPLSESATATIATYDESTAIGTYLTGLDKKGGAINYTMLTETNGMADIVIALRTNWVDGSGTYHELDNLTDYINVQVNGLDVQTEDITITDDRDNWTSVVLSKTVLVQGKNTVKIATKAYNNLDNKNDFLYVMPDIRNIAVMSNVEVSKPAVEE